MAGISAQPRHAHSHAKSLYRALVLKRKMPHCSVNLSDRHYQGDSWNRHSPDGHNGTTTASTTSGYEQCPRRILPGWGTNICKLSVYHLALRGTNNGKSGGGGKEVEG